MNILLKTDNLVGLEYLIKQKGLAGKIDLIYTDPPFATNGNFTITNGRATTISNSQRGDVAYSDKLTGLEFIEYIKKRVILMHKLLSDKGSLYIHTDYKIGHYVKVMLDEVFGIENFRNDITRIKCNPKNFNKIGYGNIKDMILFYSKGQNPIWNEPRTTYTDEDINRLFKKSKNGRLYTTVPIHAPGEALSPQKFKGMLPPAGRHWRTDVETLNQWDKDGLIEWSANGVPRKIVYADERKGKRVQDIWEYKDPQYPIYPTEKNIDFIKMIVETSSNKDSIVLDPFCGSGTTLQAATSLARKWIGIDQSDIAIKTTKKRMGIDEVSLFESNTEFLDLTECKESKVVSQNLIQ